MVSASRRSGGAIYAKKLSQVLGARTIAAELPVSQIVSEVERGSDVVDIQFEYRTFGSHLRTLTRLPLLVFLLRNVATTFVTVHGVLTYASLRGVRFRFWKWLAFVISLRLTGLFCRFMIVHTEEMRRELSRLGLKNVAVVPHGSGPLDYRRQEASRSGVLFFGFVRPSKGLESLVLAFRQVVAAHPGASLTIAGGANDPVERSYLRRLGVLVEEAGLRPNITFRTGFLSEAQKESLAGESAVLVLPYTDTYLEVSGVLHDFSGYGVSVICSRTPRFAELRDGLNCLKVEVTPSELAGSINLLLGDAELRERLASNLYALAESESWDAVGGERLALYGRLVLSAKDDR
ncbi:MAG: glycosyltransferase [Thaumarchaeota archaeon]|nr:glycosyltransferase [Nitrososphaerota archaeon]